MKRVLIANRGEIAVRVIRACREMGLETVAVFSEPDREALHAQMADRAVCIGPAPAAKSYLNMQAILSVAVETGCKFIHPGYGLLSENAKFARMCEQCNITFIGPPPGVIEAMGNKLKARLTMIEAGVPVVPGSKGLATSLDQALEDAKAAGYPVLVKAAAGGGGRGIRRVDSEAELPPAIDSARAEAEAAFGDGSVYIEKLLFDARHIEVQIMADTKGSVCHLYERDCSLQRRRQKVLEETPAVGLSDELRQAMGESAVRAAKAVGYANAGTVEFLLDDNGNYYFMEMNTRLQVEHPVTELVTNIDIVKEQLRVAMGEPLSFKQSGVRQRGHAIECRINAEDAEKNFMPSCGSIEVLHMPAGPGVRLDSMLYDGCEISPHYDSMVAKIIVHDKTREEAIARMRRALMEVSVEGVTLNTEFQLGLLDLPAFVEGKYNTGTIEGLLKR